MGTALANKLREEEDWKATGREIKARLEEQGLWAGNGQGMRSPGDFALAVIEENEMLWENSRLPELEQYNWNPVHAANALDLISTLLI